MIAKPGPPGLAACRIAVIWVSALGGTIGQARGHSETPAGREDLRAIHYMARSGRIAFVEIDLAVGPKLAVQMVARQDELRRRIWEAVGLPLERAWLSIALTAGPHWA